VNKQQIRKERITNALQHPIEHMRQLGVAFR